MSLNQRLRHNICRRLAPRFYLDYLPSLTPRPMTTFIKQNNGDKSLVGVEIGVYSGKNSKSLLETLNIKTLYLVDPYINYSEGKNTVNMSNAVKIEALQTLSCFSDKIKWVFKKSEDAINDIPNNLDFVYIDGNHSYDFVTKDIELYYPKVKRNGVIGGHDFTLRYYSSVVFAVTDFCRKNNLELKGDITDWFIVKSD